MIITCALATILMSSTTTLFLFPRTHRRPQNITSEDDNRATYTQLSSQEKKQLELKAICDRENRRNEIAEIRIKLAMKKKF